MAISTIICGAKQEGLPKLVWVHGYGASGALFYKVMQGLTQKFQVFFVDIIGMGGSSRSQDFDKKAGYQEMLSYIVTYLERWRQRIGLNKFYLTGHSFGGFIAGHYACAYP